MRSTQKIARRLFFDKHEIMSAGMADAWLLARHLGNDAIAFRP
jgi:hypothetical protein